MLEIFELTADNIDEVAKATGQKPRDLQIIYETCCAEGKKPKVYIDKPEIPEGYGRVN